MEEEKLIQPSTEEKSECITYNIKPDNVIMNWTWTWVPPKKEKKQ